MEADPTDVLKKMKKALGEQTSDDDDVDPTEDELLQDPRTSNGSSFEVTSDVYGSVVANEQTTDQGAQLRW